jgi:hypothetical protein
MLASHWVLCCPTEANRLDWPTRKLVKTLSIPFFA